MQIVEPNDFLFENSFHVSNTTLSKQKHQRNKSEQDPGKLRLSLLAIAAYPAFD